MVTITGRFFAIYTSLGKAPLCKGSCQKSSDFWLRDCCRSTILPKVPIKCEDLPYNPSGTACAVPPPFTQGRLWCATKTHPEVRPYCSTNWKLSNQYKQISNQRPCEYGKVYERNPRLVVHIELFKSQTPRVFDQYPTEHIKYNTYACPYCSRNQSFRKSRFSKIVHI